MFMSLSKRLVLRFGPGQFSFRHFVNNAGNQALYDLAQALNSLQADEAKEVLTVEEFEFIG